jgi:predicted TIM-barrel fold metal-dependent hydrolase
MDEGTVRELASQHPDLHIVVTHLGEQVDVAKLSGVTVPSDFEVLSL